MWRSDRPGRQDDLAPRLDLAGYPVTRNPHAGCAFVFKQNPVHLGMGHHGQVRPCHRRAQVGIRSRPAHAIFDRHMHRAKAFLALPVVVRGEFVTRLLSGIDKCLVQRVQHVIAVIGG